VTNKPSMVAIGLFSEKPMPAAAQFSTDATIGISARPIGMMMSTPSTNTTNAMTMSGDAASARKKILDPGQLQCAGKRTLRRSRPPAGSRAAGDSCRSADH
jgi:hypothetical protein